MKIRFATTDDTSSLLEIYSQYIDTPITFEYTLPTENEFKNRIVDISKDYPYLVCEDDGKIIAYAYAHRHMSREAYQWNAELSIYIDNTYTSKGLGRKLYTILIEILKLQGVKTVYGCVTIPNEKSEKLHKSLGFESIGIYHNGGYKCKRWHDVKWFGKAISPYDLNPESFLSISKISEEELITKFVI